VSTEEFKSNAALICAAPLMYKACMLMDKIYALSNCSEPEAYLNISNTDEELSAQLEEVWTKIEQIKSMNL
jgi:hypothetical protein